jgi:hypothetical protein
VKRSEGEARVWRDWCVLVKGLNRAIHNDWATRQSLTVDSECQLHGVHSQRSSQWHRESDGFASIVRNVGATYGRDDTYWFSKPIPRCRRLMHVKPITFSSLSRERRGLAELLTVRAYALDILYHAPLKGLSLVSPFAQCRCLR